MVNYEGAYSQAQQIYDMHKLVKKENHLIFGRVFTQMSKAKLGLGNAKEALEYTEKAKTIFISDTNRPNDLIRKLLHHRIQAWLKHLLLKVMH